MANVDINSMATGQLEDYLTDKLANIATDKHEDLLKLANVVTMCTLIESGDAGGASLTNSVKTNGDLKTLGEMGLNSGSGNGAQLDAFAKENGYAGGWDEYVSDVNQHGMGREAGGLTAGGPIRIQAAQQDIQTTIDAVLAVSKAKVGLAKKIAQHISQLGS